MQGRRGTRLRCPEREGAEGAGGGEGNDAEDEHGNGRGGGDYGGGCLKEVKVAVGP